MLNEYPPPKGLRITSGSVTINKMVNEHLIGITIGGGYPNCPVTYIIQINEGSPASKANELDAGDEILSINGVNIQKLPRSDTAKLIHDSINSVTIQYNKLHIDDYEMNSMELSTKKFKHKMVENMSSPVADVLGISRAVLVNDSICEQIQIISRKYKLFKQMIGKITKFIQANFQMSFCYKKFGDVLTEIGMRESQQSANKSFCEFGNLHRSCEKSLETCNKNLMKAIEEFNMFNQKTVPDMRSSLKKYLDSKFEYLSYCLKIKEMDDEEYNIHIFGDFLYRVVSGNYEYRALLRLRQLAKDRFSEARKDFLIKMDLFSHKSMQSIISNLQLFLQSLIDNYQQNIAQLKGLKLFPIDLDIDYTTFQNNLDPDEDCEDVQTMEEDPVEYVEELNSISTLEPLPNRHIDESFIPNIQCEEKSDSPSLL